MPNVAAAVTGHLTVWARIDIFRAVAIFTLLLVEWHWWLVEPRGCEGSNRRFPSSGNLHTAARRMALVAGEGHERLVGNLAPEGIQAGALVCVEYGGQRQRAMAHGDGEDKKRDRRGTETPQGNETHGNEGGLKPHGDGRGLKPTKTEGGDCAHRNGGDNAHGKTTSWVMYHPQTNFFLSNGPQTDSRLGSSVLAQDRQLLE